MVVEERVKQWRPIPAGMIAGLIKTRWTKANQAPEVVGYAWALHLIENGSTVSRRDLATYAGWSEWQARKVLDLVTANMAEWHGKEAATPQTAQQPPSNRPATPVIPDTSDPDSSSRRPAAARLRTRDPLVTPTISTELHEDKEDMSDKPSQVWEKVNQIRKRHTPDARALKLTKARRAVLKARLEEHTEEEILRVVEWRESSPHSRAVFLREGGHGVDTLLRASKFEGYLDASYGDQAPAIRKSNGLMDPMTAIRKARESRLRKEAAASGSTVVPFPHPIPNKEPF